MSQSRTAHIAAGHVIGEPTEVVHPVTGVRFLTSYCECGYEFEEALRTVLTRVTPPAVQEILDKFPADNSHIFPGGDADLTRDTSPGGSQAE